MKYIQVQFQQSTGVFGGKTYIYRSKLPLLLGGVYDIIADDVQTYNSHVKVVGIEDHLCNYPYDTRVITGAVLVNAPPKPKSPIRQVQFNIRKGVTTVVWADGSHTMVTCDSRDQFDCEKALALCFMKHFGYNDRSSFNDDIHKWCL